MLTSPDRVYYIGPAATIEEALDRFRNFRGKITADTETVNTKDKRVIGLGLAISSEEAIYASGFMFDSNSGHTISPHFSDLMKVLISAQTSEWFNIGFDLDVLEQVVPSIDQMHWEDISIACRMQAMQNTLEGNVREYLGLEHQEVRDILEVNAKGETIANMLLVAPPKVAFKCMNDCMDTYKLSNAIDFERFYTGPEEGYIWEHFGIKQDVTPQMIRAYRLDRALIPLLRRMSRKGLALDYEFLNTTYERLASERQTYFDICQRQFGFNPGSNQQVGYILSQRKNFLPWTKNGRWKQLRVDGDSLSELSDPLAMIILEHRARADQLSDVIEPLLGKPKGAKGRQVPFSDWEALKRFYTHFRIDLATSRLASYDRQVQNITPKLRYIFDPDDEDGVKKFTWWDASQIEMRIFGFVSKDQELAKVFNEGLSIHWETMKELFPGQPKFLCCREFKCICGREDENPLYTISKTFNFAMIYNATARTLSQHTKQPETITAPLRAKWLGKYKEAADWMTWAEEDGLYRGWVPTLEGRRLRIPDISFRGEQHSRTCCINYRVQGSASWPIKVALLDGDARGFDERIQLHDEVVINGDVYNDIPREEYSHLMGDCLTPVDVKSGPKWS